MPTYRIPVRAEITGHVLIRADDPRLALASLESEGFPGIADAQWVGSVDGEPVEVEPVDPNLCDHRYGSLGEGYCQRCGKAEP